MNRWANSVQELSSRPALRLPSIVRNPSAETVRIASGRPIAPTTAALPKLARLISAPAGNPSPPKGGPSKKKSDNRTLPESLKRKIEHLAVDDLTELTLLYINILKRSEDYNRRELIKMQERARNQMQSFANCLKEMHAFFYRLERELVGAEEAARMAIQKAEEDALAMLRRQRNISLLSAKDAEVLSLHCQMIQATSLILFSPELCDGVFIDIFWRGIEHLEGCMTLLCEKGKRLGNVTRHDHPGIPDIGLHMPLRFVERVGSGLIVGGGRERYFVRLHALPPRTSKLIISVLNPDGTGFDQLREAYVIIRSTEKGLKELYAYTIPRLSGDAQCCFMLIKRQLHWTIKGYSVPFFDLQGHPSAVAHYEESFLGFLLLPPAEQETIIAAVSARSSGKLFGFSACTFYTYEWALLEALYRAFIAECEEIERHHMYFHATSTNS